MVAKGRSATLQGWESWYKRFLAWTPDEKGRRIVPVPHVTHNGYKLGVWQQNQRQLYKKGQLNDKKISLLEKAGIVWDMYDFYWDEGFKHFLASTPNGQGHRLAGANAECVRCISKLWRVCST